MAMRTPSHHSTAMITCKQREAAMNPRGYDVLSPSLTTYRHCHHHQPKSTQCRRCHRRYAHTHRGIAPMKMVYDTRGGNTIGDE